MDWVVTITAWVLLTAVLAIGGIALWQQLSHLRFIQYHRYKNIALPRLTPGGFLRLHLGEVWAWLVLGWWTLWAGLRNGLITPDPVTGPPVICVHGFSQNGSNFWGIRRALYRRGRPSRALYLGNVGRSLQRYAPPLRRVLETGEGPVDVVCHSMGGVILRIVLRDNPEFAARIRRVVTLGSPHRGTAAPRGFAWLPDVFELSRRSPVLAALPTFEELAPHAQVTTVAALRDFIVYPGTSPLLDAADQVVLTGVGHAGLLVQRQAVDAVCNALEREEESLSRTAP